MDSTASVARDIIGGIPLLSCPPYNQTTPPVGWRSMGMFNPTITITFAIHAFISLLFAFLIYWRYNSVSLFGRRIYNNYISNTYWFAYFISIALEAILEATRYWLNLPYRQIPSTNPSIPSSDGPSISDSNVDSDTMDSATYFKLVDAAMLICTTVLHSFTLLFLACALRWQISHRGKFIKESFFQKPRTNNSHLGAGNGARNYYQNEDDIEESQSYRDELVPNENADFDGLNDYSPSLSEAFPFLNRAGI